jgi:hypothetical protein
MHEAAQRRHARNATAAVRTRGEPTSGACGVGLGAGAAAWTARCSRSRSASAASTLRLRLRIVASYLAWPSRQAWTQRSA